MNDENENPVNHVNPVQRETGHDLQDSQDTGLFASPESARNCHARRVAQFLTHTPAGPDRMPDHPLYICPARCSRNGQEGDTDPLQLEHGVPGIGDIFPS